MNKFESKYFETAQKMDEAFLSILEKKEFEYITVKEICSTAGVNRSTFYLHYETLNDLLVESGEYISRKFYHYFDKAIHVLPNVQEVDLNELLFVKDDFLEPWLRFIQDNRRLFQTFIKRHDTLGMEKNYVDIFQRIIRPILERIAAYTTNHKVYAFTLESLILRTTPKYHYNEIYKAIGVLLGSCIALAMMWQVIEFKSKDKRKLPNCRKEHFHEPAFKKHPSLCSVNSSCAPSQGQFLFKAGKRRGCRRAYTRSEFVDLLKSYSLANWKYKGERQMTLQQLKYVIAVAETGSITEAAKKLFISQPSLSGALKEIEKEAKITIFNRNRNGAALTDQGMEFVGYARQVIQQMDLLEAKYVNETTEKQRFCVSTQHYTFTANAFVEMVQRFGQDKYEFILNETQTHQIITDVKNRFCDIGILYLSEANRDVLTKIFSDRDMEFHPILKVKPHVFLNKNHPLAGKEKISLHELKEYPRLSFVQGAYESSNFSEEMFSTMQVEKSIKVSDRAAVVNLMIGLNAYTISSGIYPKYLHGDSIISIPLDVEEEMEIGYLINKDRDVSPLAQIYIEELSKYK